MNNSKGKQMASNTTWATAIRDMTAAGTLRQGVWNGEDQGRHIADILGASSPDVNSVSDVDCAALCMPQWLARLTPDLFDGVSAVQASAYALRYADVAERWCMLTPDAWDRVSVTFRIACIEQALAYAEAVQPTPRPDYWAAVQTSCEVMVNALGSGDTARVDEAASAAARAARAASAEAEAAAGAAAEAAGAAAAAAEAAAAAAAAWAREAGATYARIFDALLDAINAELAADVQEPTP